MTQSQTSSDDLNRIAAPYWAVAVCMTNREDFVGKLLTRDGFEVYGPRTRVQRRTAALFPGYLMVKVIVRWYPIRWCPGVMRLLMNGDHPAKLADAIIAEIKGREVRGLVKLPKEPGAIETGSRVRITTGNFIGKVGIYQGMNGAQRERVLLNWLGQSVPLILPLGNLEAVPTVARL